MQQYSLIAISFGLITVFLSCQTTMASVIPPCQPDGLTDYANPKIRQLCYALEQAVVDDAQLERINAEPLRLGRNIANKRQDVDHVFLRFGRRLGR